jgi:cell division cycle 2-like protein
VMPFIEHDLKTLLETMPHPFLQSEVKTLMMQLLNAVAHCHSNWIVGHVPRLAELTGTTG